MDRESISESELIDQTFTAGDNVISALETKYKPEQLLVIKKIGAFISNGMQLEEACILSFITPEVFAALMEADPALAAFILFKETVFKAKLMRTVTQHGMNTGARGAEKSAGWMLERKFRAEFHSKPREDETPAQLDALAEGLEFVRKNGDLKPLVTPKPASAPVRDVSAMIRPITPSTPSTAPLRLSMPSTELTPDIIKANFANREWRLDNLYHIRDSGGKKIPFRMNPVQRYVHQNLHYRNIIPKARKLGISTFFSILNLDQVLWSENKTAGIIAHRKEDVTRLFRDNIQFAFENMHPWLKERIGKPVGDTTNELRFNNGGSIFTSLTTRGQTPQFLHISELGYIDSHSPEKSEEIISGSINSVAIGTGNIVSIESTADNGRNGNFYELCMRAEQLRLGHVPLTELDWKIFFLPWWQDPQYQLQDADQVVITSEMKDYFDGLIKEGVFLSLPQKRWYVKSRETNRDKMFSQFPSTLAEAFSVSLEGAYYGKEVTAVYGEGRVAFFPVDPRYPVNTAWDLGVNDSTAIVFFQSIGPEIRIVDLYEHHGVGLQHYANVLRDKKYRYGTHILPHDVNVRDLSTGVSRLTMLGELGLTDIRVAPKIFISDGIEKVRMLFNRFRFDKGKAQKVLDSLQAYRKSWDEQKGVWSDAPFHGPESHIADAVRTMAVVWIEGMNEALVDQWGEPVKDGVKIESMFSA